MFYNGTTSYQLTQNGFITPERIIESLLLTKIGKCGCQQDAKIENQSYNKNNEYLKQQIIAIQSQLSEVQRLIGIRDALYQKLDILKHERESIQAQISENPIQQSKKMNYMRQMNERLRRRILQVEKYIKKMKEENIKIERGLESDQKGVFMERIEWQNQFRRNPLEATRYGGQNIGNLRMKVEKKHQEMWERLRSQQRQINQRNQTSYEKINRRLNSPSGYSNTNYGWGNHFF